MRQFFLDTEERVADWPKRTHYCRPSEINKFVACTPEGQEPLFIHAVQTAPIYANGAGWGVGASEDNRAFRRLVWSVLEKTYGPGIGASMSYHDFGERAFAKRHPHVDFTLNGWMLKGGKPVETPVYDHPDPEIEAWEDDIVRAASKRWPGAERGTFFIRRPVEGVAAYVKAIKYQMRELVDFKRIRYDAARGRVTWARFDDGGTHAVFTVEEFKVGFAEYERRLHPWARNSGGRPLDGRYGHLSDRARSKTVEIMGGREHEDECQCQRCRDWQRIPFEVPNPSKVR